MSRTPLFLFAEDDDEDWMLIQHSFEHWTGAYLTERVKDGEELLERLRDNTKASPDVILLDIKMPRKNGIEALKEIRADNGLKHLPVIMMTGSTSEVDILNSYVEGCNSFMVKLVSPNNMKVFHHYWTQVSKVPKRSRFHEVKPLK